MTTTDTVTAPVFADALRKDDRFAYSGETVKVLAVKEIGPVAAGTLVEVNAVGDDSGIVRYIDHVDTEVVHVVSGPSFDAAFEQEKTHAPAPTKTATQVAREAIRLGKTRTLPASATLVLYAVAAAEEEVTRDFAPNTGSVATGASLAISTTLGHLRSLQAKGLVHGSNVDGWWVAR